MKKTLLSNIHLISVLFFILASFETASGEMTDLPFHTGEKMTFQVKWSFIIAGEATIELLPLTKINDEDAYHFLFTAHTSEFVDVFYKVRDRIESFTDITMSHSLLYLKRHEGKPNKDITVDFDWDKEQAQYSRKGENNKRAPVSLLPGTFDPLSVFFAFRLNDFDKKNAISIPVTDGKKIAMGKVNIIKRELVEVRGINYDTFLVEPELGEIGGVFEKSKEAKLQIWITADNRHIPVRIESQVTVGSFVAELTSYDDGVVSENGNR
jgi:hypothetical protein